MTRPFSSRSSSLCAANFSRVLFPDMALCQYLKASVQAKKHISHIPSCNFYYKVPLIPDIRTSPPLPKLPSDCHTNMYMLYVRPSRSLWAAMHMVTAEIWTEVSTFGFLCHSVYVIDFSLCLIQSLQPNLLTQILKQVVFSVCSGISNKP